MKARHLSPQGAQYDSINEGIVTEIGKNQSYVEYQHPLPAYPELNLQASMGTAQIGMKEVTSRARKGDRIRVYIHGGSLVSQVDLNDHTVMVKTPAQEEAEFKKWQTDYDARLHREYENGGKTRLDEEYLKLPIPLKRRLDRFRAEDPDFRWKEEAYEMAACAEAGRLYRAALDPETGRILKDAGIKIGDPNLKSYDQPMGEGRTDWEDTPENRLRAINAINDPPNNYDYKLLEKLFPWIDKGHSGNTWGHAVAFARLLVLDGDKAVL